MADSDELVNDLEEECKCALCLDLFTEPRVLSCQHTFCTLCLEEAHKRERSRNILVCPICREETILKNLGVLSLQKNRQMANIVEKLKQTRLAASAPNCASLAFPIANFQSRANKMQVDSSIYSNKGPNPAPLAESSRDIAMRYFASAGGLAFPSNDVPSAPPVEDDAPIYSVSTPTADPQFFPPAQGAAVASAPPEPFYAEPAPNFFPPGQMPGSPGPQILASVPAQNVAPIPPPRQPNPQYLPSHFFSAQPASPPPAQAPVPAPALPPRAQPPVSPPVHANSAPRPNVQATVAAPRPPASPDKIAFAPFGILNDRIPGYFQQWISQLSFAPVDFVNKSRILHVEPMMIPYWLMDIKVETKYSAETKASENSLVKPVNGVRLGAYPNVLYNALDDNVSTYHIIVQMDDDWDYSFAIPEAPGVLASVLGFFGKKTEPPDFSKPPREGTVLPSIPWQAAYKRKEQKNHSLEVEAVRRLLTATDMRTIVQNMRVSVAVVEHTKTLVYLPAFCLLYTYNNETLTMIINGQTGKGYDDGNRPRTVVGRVLSAGWSALTSVGGALFSPKR